jgi:hypothetical protein
MRGRERRHAENVHIILDRLTRGFRRCMNNGPINASKPVGA